MEEDKTIENQSLEDVLAGVSVGAQLYNIIRKCGININPAIFKDFEHRSVKYILDTAGVKPDEGKEDEVYTFDTFVRSYFESVALMQYMFSENKRLVDKLKELGVDVKDVASAQENGNA